MHLDHLLHTMLIQHTHISLQIHQMCTILKTILLDYMEEEKDATTILIARNHNLSCAGSLDTLWLAIGIGLLSLLMESLCNLSLQLIAEDKHLQSPQ